VTAPPTGSAGETGAPPRFPIRDLLLKLFNLDPSKAPMQIGTWIDGFQLVVRSSKALRINMDFINASDAKIQPGFKVVCAFSIEVRFFVMSTHGVCFLSTVWLCRKLQRSKH
jgi:hypothetical protein